MAIQLSERGDVGYGESIVSATKLIEHQGDAGYGESIDSATKKGGYILSRSELRRSLLE